MPARVDNRTTTADPVKPLGDRRGRIRLEVVGLLWGALEIDHEARILNIGKGGALLASPVPAAVGSLQTVRVVLSQQEFKIQARVRHVQRPEPGDEEPSYRLGLEFLNVPLAFGKTFQ